MVAGVPPTPAMSSFSLDTSSGTSLLTSSANLYIIIIIIIIIMTSDLLEVVISQAGEVGPCSA